MVLARNKQTKKPQTYRRMESPKINKCMCGQLTYDKRTKNIQWGKDRLFKKWCWQNWTTTCKHAKLNLHLIPPTKMNSKYIVYLNIRSETLKLLRENIGDKLPYIGLSDDFFRICLQKQRQRKITNQWGLYQTEKILHSKGSHHQN